jgi:hypothetical protein
MLCTMEGWRRNFEQELEKVFTISDNESNEFFLATLVDHGDDEEAAGPSRRGGSVRGHRFVMRDREGWHHFRQAATVTILFPQFAPSIVLNQQFVPEDEIWKSLSECSMQFGRCQKRFIARI